MPLTVVATRDDLLSKVGVVDIADASALLLQDVAVAINWAMQILQSAGEDYFTRQTLTHTLSAGTATYTIPASIQSVLGPLRWNDIKPLRALDSQGELDQYARIFGGESGYGAGVDGDPEAYWVKYLRAGTGDICNVTITLAPAPAAPAGTIVFDAINDAPGYVVADLTSTAAIPVAQNYTESIFLPLARMAITRSHQFSRPDILAQLTTDYQLAMARLGLSGGFPVVDQPLPPRKTIG